ncbi:MAG TPA: HAD family phosphatase [Candidatus Saccharimonadales bacterium]|nr:HAD family phosphatase [Candidatus Saccharimonadales bacterium]
MSTIAAVVFDMDGVLINSVDAAYHARAALLREYGVDIDAVPDPHNEAHKGSSAAKLLAAVREYSGIVIDEKAFVERAVAGMRAELLRSNTSADPHLVRLLDALRDAAIPLAIATAGRRVGVDIKLDILGIAPYFTVVISADDVSEDKPSPAPYLAAASRLGVYVGRCIVFEDSLAGAQSGVAAGATVVGFSKYSASQQPLPGTARTIADWSDIDISTLHDLISDKYR